MIDRLQRALEHVDDLSPEVQEDSSRLPRRIRTALAAIGSARDLQDDDEFTALDRIRHESVTTPSIELDDPALLNFW